MHTHMSLTEIILGTVTTDLSNPCEKITRSIFKPKGKRSTCVHPPHSGADYNGRREFTHLIFFFFFEPARAKGR